MPPLPAPPPRSFAPATPAQLAFVEQFQTGTLQLIANLPAGTGVFSPTCLVHCLSGQPTFSDLTVAGTSFSNALSNWYFNGAQTQVVSSCTGWSCINQCGIVATGNPNAGLPCNTGTQGCSPVQLATDADGTVVWPPGMGPPAPAPGTITATETSLSPAQLDWLNQMKQQHGHGQQGGGHARRLQSVVPTTLQRLLSAAPACCNGRARE
jgi:hypothetical protein